MRADVPNPHEPPSLADHLRGGRFAVDTCADRPPEGERWSSSVIKVSPPRPPPRLAQTRPEPTLLADLFEQLRATMSALALRGWAHGDLSPYNTLLHNDRLVIIDWPQIVDIIGNPRGPEFLRRDCHNMCSWFAARGLVLDDEEELFGDCMASAMSRW